MSKTEDEYVYVWVQTTKKVKVPKDCAKCPTCEGSGEVRVYYGQPWDRGQFSTCHMCGGRGYVEKSFLDLWSKIQKKSEAEK